MSISRCFVGALHDQVTRRTISSPSSTGIPGYVWRHQAKLQRTTLRASYRRAGQHKCCAQALSPLRVNSDRSLHAENRAMSAVPRKRRNVRALASVAKAHGGGRRGPLQRPATVARCRRSIGWAALAFEGGFSAIALDVHLEDRGVVHEPVDSRERHGLVAEHLGMPQRLTVESLTCGWLIRTILFTASASGQRSTLGTGTTADRHPAARWPGTRDTAIGDGSGISA
jgi:hypothetical protein